MRILKLFYSQDTLAKALEEVDRIVRGQFSGEREEYYRPSIETLSIYRKYYEQAIEGSNLKTNGQVVLGGPGLLSGEEDAPFCRPEDILWIQGITDDHGRGTYGMRLNSDRAEMEQNANLLEKEFGTEYRLLINTLIFEQEHGVEVMVAVVRGYCPFFLIQNKGL